MSKFKVGDKVVLTGVNERGHRLVQVVKVGRKYAHVQFTPWDTKAFDLEDGSEVGNYSHYSICTQEEFAAAQERDAAIEALRKHGVGFDWTIKHRISTATLQRIAAVLDEELA